jgi:hypothetical protein
VSSSRNREQQFSSWGCAPRRSGCLRSVGGFVLQIFGRRIGGFVLSNAASWSVGFVSPIFVGSPVGFDLPNFGRCLVGFVLQDLALSVAAGPCLAALRLADIAGWLARSRPRVRVESDRLHAEELTAEAARPPDFVRVSFLAARDREWLLSLQGAPGQRGLPLLTSKSLGQLLCQLLQVVGLSKDLIDRKIMAERVDIRVAGRKEHGQYLAAVRRPALRPRILLGIE